LHTPYWHTDKQHTSKHDGENLCELVTNSHIEEDFKKFVEHMGEHDKTWKFWEQFVFIDCFNYFALYLTVRSSNWELRLANL